MNFDTSKIVDVGERTSGCFTSQIPFTVDNGQFVPLLFKVSRRTGSGGVFIPPSWVTGSESVLVCRFTPDEARVFEDGLVRKWVELEDARSRSADAARTRLISNMGLNPNEVYWPQ